MPARSPGSSSEWSSTRARGQGADAASAPGLAPQLHAPASRRIPHSADVSGDVALLARRRPRSRLARCLAGQRARRAHPNGVRRARRPRGTPGSGALPGRARLCRRGHGPRRPYLRRVRHEAPCHEHPPQARSQRRRDREGMGYRVPRDLQQPLREGVPAHGGAPRRRAASAPSPSPWLSRRRVASAPSPSPARERKANRTGTVGERARVTIGFARAAEAAEPDGKVVPFRFPGARCSTLRARGARPSCSSHCSSSSPSSPSRAGRSGEPHRRPS